jgi:hypothetical protein
MLAIALYLASITLLKIYPPGYYLTSGIAGAYVRLEALGFG